MFHSRQLSLCIFNNPRTRRKPRNRLYAKVLFFAIEARVVNEPSFTRKLNKKPQVSDTIPGATTESESRTSASTRGNHCHTPSPPSTPSPLQLFRPRAVHSGDGGSAKLEVCLLRSDYPSSWDAVGVARARSAAGREEGLSGDYG